ncbi:chemotaxis protein CheW [Ottowia sp. GY511]|uniref:Chemotaxis protein CheW n=1 Tax=Ottowia flava TaxID=2675430 RepID=A0ABW4KWP6_9BURK|nr:chemotaxis protein CheW [Ottowia sp. GY511]TXK29817.1 chemotaxis protein CheW [Ottowia sp. GY511]
MSNKQALREFQSRLAQRLQSARMSGVSASWLAVEAGSRRLLFPLSHAGEIFSWTDVQSVPYTHEWFLGVANLRGGLHGVVDLAAFVEAGDAIRRSELELSQSRLVALNPMLDTNCAVLVDRLQGLRTAEAFASSSPADGELPPYFGPTFIDLDGAQWQEINLQALSQHQPFLGIGV